MLSEAVWKNLSRLYRDHPLECTRLTQVPDRTYYRKKLNPSQMYVSETVATNDLRCLECNMLVKRGRVSHRIGYRGIDMSDGARQVEYEEVPYCEMCEEVPHPIGKVIVHFI